MSPSKNRAPHASVFCAPVALFYQLTFKGLDLILIASPDEYWILFPGAQMRARAPHPKHSQNHDGSRLMKYTAAHWGAYTFAPGAQDLTPLHSDSSPSRVGQGWVSASQNRAARVLAPAVRKGWLDGDNGANRCNDTFVEVSWDRALDLAAAALDHTRTTSGNQAIYGGSYGWSSAGRFHHAQSQMRRCLALAGGFTSSRETYSHATGEILFPHLIGQSIYDFQDQMTSMPLITQNAEIVLAFGGLAGRTGQVAAAGTSFHEVPGWIADLKHAGVRVITIAPEKGEALGDWWPIRPGTDTALILALIHEITAAGREDHDFLNRCTSGWDTLRAYVMGADGTPPKTADWAAAICDIPADHIRDLARDLCTSRSMITMTWAMQRADHGEQPIWAGLALACVLGQIGQPGTGYGFGYGSISAVGRPIALMPWPSLPKVANKIRDYIPVARITDALLSPGAPYSQNGTTRQYPDLKLVWWTGGNPFHHHQDLRRLEQAWTRPETVIVNDHCWTATARRADIVLPATTPLERDDIMMNRRDPTLLYMSAMHAPIGQARDDFDIFTDISERLGTGAAFTENRSTQDWLRHLWHTSQDVARAHGFDLPAFDDFRETGRFDLPLDPVHSIAFADFVRDPTAHPLGTESGGFTLTNRGIGAMNLPDCPDHPTWMPPIEGAPLSADEFHLISGQPMTRLHAQNDQGAASQGAKVQGREACTLHPDAASDLGVVAGDVVRLCTARGACLAGVQISDALRADCVSLPTGAWYDPQVVDGAYLEVHGNPNALTRDKGSSSLSQGNIAHTCVVRVEKWTKPLPDVSVTKPPPIDR